MSQRYRGGFLTNNPPALGIPPGSYGISTVNQQVNARGQGLWPAPAQAPTGVTATAGINTCASVSFTAPTCRGYPTTITNYTVTTSPGCYTATGTSSPIVVTGMVGNVTYTFRVRANNTSGLRGACSAPSSGVYVPASGSLEYATPGTYTWVAPTNVTSVSVVAVGGGADGYNMGGGGGGLGYRNNIAVTPGNSYTVVVGASNSNSYFINTSTVRGGGAGGVFGGSYTGDGGGSGGTAQANWNTGGAGAGGYAGTGGYGGYCCGGPGAGGAGGGGGGAPCGGGGGYGGGTVLYGQGASGAGGGFYSNGGTGSFVAGKNSYGGGAGASCPCGGTRGGQTGGVRLVWPGNTRFFPSTNVSS